APGLLCRLDRTSRPDAHELLPAPGLAARLEDPWQQERTRRDGNLVRTPRGGRGLRRQEGDVAAHEHEQRGQQRQPHASLPPTASYRWGLTARHTPAGRLRAAPYAAGCLFRRRRLAGTNQVAAGLPYEIAASTRF